MKPLPMRLILLLFALFLLRSAMGQQFSITAGTVNTCAGVLEDSGGPSAQYSDNENFTVVICPDIPGDGISLQWLVANLSTAGPNNTHDQLSVWDGNSTSATSLGSYTGAALQGLIVSATTFNATGCLTVQFTSNGVGVGDFAASITCFTPCERPIAVATMSEPAIPAMVCQNEVIQFDGSGSYPAQSFNIVSYTWDFRDGTTASGATASHSFAEPGEYVVQLSVEDDNGCVNSNVVDLQVLVSTTPIFNGTVESHETCLGATVNLSAVVTPVTWTALPEANFGDGVFLPDDVGQPFTSELNFAQFDPGQTILSVSNIQSICVNMEHSYMGDLVLQVICPNGQSMIFHQQGGGGTYLGSPNDGDNNTNPILGECWEYCWSPTATNGTWVANSNTGSQNTTLAGTPPNQSLNPGTYQPVQPFTNLLGCPLNGVWTYQSTDLWAADNGFICSWSINFDPTIIPDATQFTPVPGVSTPDSAAWTGPGLVIDPAQPLLATSTPTAPGDYTYAFAVTDNFGCTYDTTVTITIPPLPDLDAGNDIVLCSDPLPMAPSFNGNEPQATCTYTLTLYDSFSDAWNSGANIDVTVNGVTTNHTLACCTGILVIPLEVITGTTVSLNYHAGTNWNAENSFTLVDDAGSALFQSPANPPSGVLYSQPAQCVNGTYLATFVWTPTTGLGDPSAVNTPVFVTEPTMYYLSTYPPGHPECAVTDSVLVSPDPSINPGLPAAIVLCESDGIIQLVDSLGGTPDAGGIWTNSAGVVVPNSFNAAVDLGDVYTYTVVSAAGCAATSTLGIVVLPAEDPSCCGIIDAGPDAFSCDLTITLSAIRGNTGVGNWVGPNGAVFVDAFSNETSVSVQPGMGGIQKFYWVENDGAFCDMIDSVAITFTDAYDFMPTITDALCFGYCDGEVDMAITGGNAVAGLTYTWSDGTGGVGANIANDLCAGSYTLQVADDNGCIGTTDVVVGQPILLEIDSMATLPVTCSGDCDGTVLVFDGEAVEYSYDEGASWTTDPARPAACEAVWMVWIKDAIGCIGTGQVEVTGPPPVIASFAWTPNPANVDAPLVLFSNTSTGSDHYYWNVAGLYSTTDLNTSFTFNNKEPDIYEVCLTAYNFNECADTVCEPIVVEDVLFTYIPNAFTPDGDDVNDMWWPTANIPVRSNFELLVFDRWGQVVFSTSDPYEPWQGRHQNSGEVLKSDVYPYRLLFGIQNTETRREILGYVTLMK